MFFIPTWHVNPGARLLVCFLRCLSPQSSNLSSRLLKLGFIYLTDLQWEEMTFAVVFTWLWWPTIQPLLSFSQQREGLPLVFLKGNVQHVIQCLTSVWGTPWCHMVSKQREELELDNSKVSTAALNKTNPLHYVYIHVFFCPGATINDTYWHCQMTIWHWVMSSCLDLALHTQVALNMPKWDWNQGPEIPPNPVYNFCTAQMDYITMWLN